MSSAWDCEIRGGRRRGVGDLPRVRPVASDLLRALGCVGARHREARDLADLVEERGHRLLDRRVVDALVGAEHDRAAAPGALAAEVGDDDVVASLALDVRERRIGPIARAGGGGDGTAADESHQPDDHDSETVPIAPTTETSEHVQLRRAEGRTEGDRGDSATSKYRKCALVGLSRGPPVNLDTPVRGRGERRGLIGGPEGGVDDGEDPVAVELEALRTDPSDPAQLGQRSGPGGHDGARVLSSNTV